MRTKSQNSSSTTSGVKDAKKSKEDLDKIKKENERKKTERFDKKLQSVNEDFQRRCKMHLQNTVDECDTENAPNPQYVAEFTTDIMKHFMATEMMN